MYHTRSLSLSLSLSCYRHHENIKKRAYEQRVREIEHASFVPLVMSITGELGRIATTMYKRLDSLLSSKWNQPYSTTMGWLRCRLSFALLRSSITAIRGARSTSHCVSDSIAVDLVTTGINSTVNCFLLTQLFMYIHIFLFPPLSHFSFFLCMHKLYILKLKKKKN